MLKPVRWTPDLVSHFWDALTETKLLDIGFSKLAGRYLFEAVRWHLKPGARHLDFGAGDGDFVEVLAAGGYPAAAFESSERRRQAIFDRLGGKPGFLGAIGPNTRESFDAVFMIEVIEHILDEQVGSTLELVRRFLDPTVRLVVTTPNSENLDHAMGVFPTERRVFPRWLGLGGPAGDDVNGSAQIEYVVAPSDRRHVEGHCWSAQVGTAFGMGDWAGEKQRSRLELREEGLELGPSHSDLAVIAKEGRGRFAHHGPNLFFAASDNIPPDPNGRGYVVSGPPAGGSVAGSFAPLPHCPLAPS